MLDRYLDQGLVHSLQKAAKTDRPGQLISALEVRGSPGQGPAPIGKGRAADLAVNVVLPFLQASASSGTDSPNEGGAEYLEFYHRFGRLQDNDVIREMSQHLMAPLCPEAALSAILTTARRQQGLLHLRGVLAGAG